MTRSRKELDALLGVERASAILDTPDEIWARVPEGFSSRMCVWRDGRVLESEPAPLASPVRARRVWYRFLDQLVIEREVHDDGAIVRRAVMNGVMHAARERGSDEAAEAARYAALGFRELSAWEVQPLGRIHRHYVRTPDGGRPEIWVISTAGAEVRESGGERWFENRRAEACADPAAAIARAEARIAEQAAAGFRPRLIERLDGVSSHPVPPLTPSPDPYTAVDAAVARVRELVRAQPNGQLLVEELDPAARPEDAARLAAHGHDTFFCQLHAHKLGAWARLAGAEVPRTGSSLDYFFAKYGSLTWIVSSEIDEGLPMFHCGNVSGGGWSCLELDDTGYDTSGADEIYPGRGYAAARVFHGGWGRTGYLIDTRVTSATGEQPIYPFCDDGPIDDDALMPEAPIAPEAIEPFGFWLERLVHELVSEISHRLPFLN